MSAITIMYRPSLRPPALQLASFLPSTVRTASAVTQLIGNTTDVNFRQHPHRAILLHLIFNSKDVGHIQASALVHSDRWVG